MASLPRRALSELLGAAGLACAVIGSGIMADTLTADDAVALIANTLATAAVLVALILTLGPISAHFNPAVTIHEAARGKLRWRDVGPLVLAQFLGCYLGALAAHFMFSLPMVQVSSKSRDDIGLIVAEIVATSALLLVIRGVSRSRPAAVPYAVACVIASAYWFTSSTSFANPAITVARALSDTFAGIRPADAPVFIAGQLVGVGAALVVGRLLFPEEQTNG